MTEPAVGADTDDARVQLAGFVAFCRRAASFWRVPVVILVLGGAAAVTFLILRKPTYRSETVILYSEGVRPPDDEDRPENARGIAVRFKEILMSRAALDAVVREFDLYPDVRRTRGPVDAVEELRKRVEYRAPGGDTFSIGFTGASPTEAQRVTSRLAELVVDRDSQLRKTRAIVTRDFLEQEERTTERDLREKEQALAAFMGAHPRFAFDTTPSATGAAFRASFGAASPTARSPSGMARPRAEGAAMVLPIPGGTLAGAAAGPSNGEEARAAAALAAARTNLAELMTRFTSAHPDVRSAAAEVERAENRLAAAKGAPAPPAPNVATTESPKQADAASKAAPAPPPPSRSAPRAPSASPAPSGAREPETVALETEWVKLTRAVTEARQHQDHIEAALFKASLAASSESGGHGVQVTIIDPAFLPEKPIPPGRATIAGVFAAVSALLGIVGAVLFAIFDDRIHAGREISPLLPVLAEIPRPFTRGAHAAS